MHISDPASTSLKRDIIERRLHTNQRRLDWSRITYRFDHPRSYASNTLQYAQKESCQADLVMQRSVANVLIRIVQCCVAQSKTDDHADDSAVVENSVQGDPELAGP